MKQLFLLTCLIGTINFALAEPAERRLLWGDTHLHTSNSFDAFLNGNLDVTPDMAYRFAKGEPMVHPYHRARVQIRTPLDFLVVSDHAEFLGGIKDIYYEGIGLEDPNLIEEVVLWYRENQIRDAIDSGEGQAFFASLLPTASEPREAAKRWQEDLADPVPGARASAKRAWHQLLETADKNNDPGTFTAFAGWEWSSQPGNANLHRVVLTNANQTTGQEFMPFASTDSPYPKDLWTWLADTEQATGNRFVAIPHNSNVSKGIMFDTRDLRGDDIDAGYARLRMQYEPIVEMTQIKGDSETHEVLSPDDMFARFETYEFYLAAKSTKYEPKRGDFVRSGLKEGLAIEAKTGENPFQFGMIGSTDSHTGLSTPEEPNFWGKFARDGIPDNKVGSALGSASGWTMSASGLAAVWADNNTRDDIMNAMFRREVYATTGPRMVVRFFGGWAFNETDLNDIATSGYAKGVSMGGTLVSADASESPWFMVEAQRDPVGARLDRVQIIKGWLDTNGDTHERIYDVAWTNDRPKGNGSDLSPVNDNVDRNTGQIMSDEGDDVLRGIWQDPEFDPTEAAFYYVRVLQVPTARHSLLDRIAMGRESSENYPDTIQERAYTSPIWFKPGS